MEETSNPTVLVKKGGLVSSVPLSSLLQNKAYIYLLQNPGKIATYCLKTSACPGPYLCTFAHDADEATDDTAQDDGKTFSILRNSGTVIEVAANLLVPNQAYRFLRKNPKKQGMECRGHPEGITKETCKYVHFISQSEYLKREEEKVKQRDNNTTNHKEQSSSSGNKQEAAASDKTEECPPPSSQCNVCFDELSSSSSSSSYLSCAKGHRTCSDCLDQYLQTVYPKKSIEPSRIPTIICFTKHCSAPPFKAGEIARTASPDSFDNYLDVYKRAVEAKALSDVSSRLRDIVQMNPVQAMTAARELERLTISKALGQSDSAFMCPNCKTGPILLSGCSNLLTHHGAKSSSKKHSAAADNSCPGCGKLYKSSDNLLKWDGIFRQGGGGDNDDDDDD